MSICVMINIIHTPCILVWIIIRQFLYFLGKWAKKINLSGCSSWCTKSWLSTDQDADTLHERLVMIIEKKCGLFSHWFHFFKCQKYLLEIFEFIHLSNENKKRWRTCVFHLVEFCTVIFAWYLYIYRHSSNKAQTSFLLS